LPCSNQAQDQSMYDSEEYLQDDDDDGSWEWVCKFLQQYDNHKLPRVSRYIMGFAMDSVFKGKPSCIP
jgi:uncharacterized membrane protein YukC